MKKEKLHKMPADLRKAIASDQKSLVAWENITPLARNEFICWVSDAKKEDARVHRIDRTRAELKEGKRRPCCWAGCIHR